MTGLGHKLNYVLNTFVKRTPDHLVTKIHEPFYGEQKQPPTELSLWPYRVIIRTCKHNFHWNAFAQSVAMNFQINVKIHWSLWDFDVAYCILCTCIYVSANVRVTVVTAPALQSSWQTLSMSYYFSFIYDVSLQCIILTVATLFCCNSRLF